MTFTWDNVRHFEVFETVDYGFVRPNNSGNMSIVVYPKRLGAWPSWGESIDVGNPQIKTNIDFVHTGEGVVLEQSYAQHMA